MHDYSVQEHILSWRAVLPGFPAIGCLEDSAVVADCNPMLVIQEGNVKQVVRRAAHLFLPFAATITSVQNEPGFPRNPAFFVVHKTHTVKGLDDATVLLLPLFAPVLAVVNRTKAAYRP